MNEDKRLKEIKDYCTNKILAEALEAGYTQKKHRQLYIWIRCGIKEVFEIIERYIKKREKKARLEGTIEGIDYALCAFEGEKKEDYKNIINYIEEHLEFCEKQLSKLEK